VGLLAESFKYQPGLMDPILPKLMDWLLGTFQQEDEGLIRNTVFCFGVMIYKNPIVMAPYYGKCL